MRAKALTAAAMLLTLGSAGCTSASKPTAEIELRVNVCVEAGRKCFALPIPAADITIETVGGIAVGNAVTDEAGKAVITLSSAGGRERIKVKATSPLLDGGFAETTVDYPNNVASVTLAATLAQGVTSPR